MASFDLKWALKLSLWITGAQVAICLVLAPHHEGFSGAYHRLNQWDSGHYLNILENGYHMPAQVSDSMQIHEGKANMAFFPSYPFLSLSVKEVTGVSSRIALLLTSQFLCFLFWLHFLLYGRWIGFSRERARFCAVTLAFYPAAFFMVAGYSESLFMASLIAFVLWVEVWIRESALKKLSVDHLSDLTPHPLKVALDYSHPPILARINSIRKASTRSHG